MMSLDILLPFAMDSAQRGAWWPSSLVGQVWVIFGLGAQAVFAARFIVQWIASERVGRSVVPVAFWYLSLAGGVMLFTYAVCWKQDPVTAIGQGPGLVVYIRNLMLIRQHKLKTEAGQG